MLAHKVVQRTARDKVEAEYDHYVALDWSLKIMAIAHMSRRDQTPRVFERPASLKDLKAYLGSLKGRVILTLTCDDLSAMLFGGGGFPLYNSTHFHFLLLTFVFFRRRRHFVTI